MIEHQKNDYKGDAQLSSFLRSTGGRLFAGTAAPTSGLLLAADRGGPSNARNAVPASFCSQPCTAAGRHRRHRVTFTASLRRAVASGVLLLHSLHPLNLRMLLLHLRFHNECERGQRMTRAQHLRTIPVPLAVTAQRRILHRQPRIHQEHDKARFPTHSHGGARILLAFPIHSDARGALHSNACPSHFALALIWTNDDKN